MLGPYNDEHSTSAGRLSKMLDARPFTTSRSRLVTQPDPAGSRSRRTQPVGQPSPHHTGRAQQARPTCLCWQCDREPIHRKPVGRFSKPPPHSSGLAKVKYPGTISGRPPTGLLRPLWKLLLEGIDKRPGATPTSTLSIILDQYAILVFYTHFKQLTRRQHGEDSGHRNVSVDGSRVDGSRVVAAKYAPVPAFCRLTASQCLSTCSDLGTTYSCVGIW